MAQVDSSDCQVTQTHEEGEDFEVRWVCREDAPSNMSFLEDREIVEKALSAVPCRLLGSDQSVISVAASTKIIRAAVGLGEDRRSNGVWKKFNACTL